MRPSPSILVALILVSPTSQVRGELRFQSTMQQVALIELFTSEGCSSCPPAEKWLSALAHENGLWTSFVPAAFHVDYWDKLGWRDTFATHQATQRQYEYAKLWGRGSVYTPCFVRNGDEWRRDNTDLAGPFRAQAGVLTAKLSDNHVWEIEYRPTAHVAEGFDVTVALLGSGIVRSIRSGENAGRELRHDFAVLVFNQVAMKANGEGGFGALITLPPETDTLANRRAIAVWIVRHGTVVPIQATGGWMSK